MSVADDIESGQSLLAHLLGPDGAKASAADLFDGLGGFRGAAVQRHFSHRFELIAAPGRWASESFQPGDLILERALGEGGLAHARMIRWSPELETESAASGHRWPDHDRIVVRARGPHRAPTDYQIDAPADLDASRFSPLQLQQPPCPVPVRPGVAAPDPPICQVAVPGFDLAGIKSWIIHHRDRLNVNNPSRTDFYLQYWTCHKEISWALLAHLVSRNAGYQMSDLDRFKQLSRAGSAIPGFPRGLSTLLLDDLFGFLESGNYLIFRDVFPQLAAYAWAKALLDQTNCDHSVALFDLLADPAFDVDPLMIRQWKAFFIAARGATPRWLAGVPAVAGHPSVIRQSLSLIANEQNHIERRIVHPHPLARSYVSPFHSALSVILGALGSLKLTKLIMPGGGATAVDLFFHTVGNFTILDERIETGRQLYFGVFLAGATRRTGIQSFAVAHPSHHGTRVDYDPLNYDMRRISLLPGGQKYSPPLVPVGTITPPWPVIPVRDPRFAHISSPPAGIPAWSPATPVTILARWLSTPTIDAFSPPQGNSDTQRAGRPLDEVVI